MKLLLSVKTLLVLLALLSFGCANNRDQEFKSMPSGDSCTENIAYLQWGVDKYFQALGKHPTDVNQLASTTDGLGPFVEGIPKCPSGNRYLINNGKVVEAH